MKSHSSALKPVVQQTTSNTTSWIGHRHGDDRSRISGQVFTCPDEGELEAIEVFPAHVTGNAPVDLSLHHFDARNKTWGPVLETSTLLLSRTDTGKWVAFPIRGLKLRKGESYGFQLKSQGGLVGLGEAAGSYDKLPCIGGQEWMAPAEDQPGDFYSYLSLAFKIEIRA